MANNKLIKTDFFWNKIKQFFRKIFNIGVSKKSIVENQSCNCLEEENVSKKEIKKLGIKNDLLTQVLKGDVDINSLTDIEIDEVTKELTLEIDKMDKEFERVKKNIVRMKKMLEDK